MNRQFLLLVTFGVFGVAIARAQEPVQEPIPDWPAPATWSPHSASQGVSTMGAVTSPLPFVGLAPCRILDTRGNGAPITGGMFTASEHRDYAVADICGIPASARALSLNITVTGPGQTGAGFLLAWPTGVAPPPVSNLNWDHAPATVGNAAVVPTTGSVSFTVNVSGPTHVIIDVNGYYGAGVGVDNTFLGSTAGNFTMTGGGNTGIGAFALFNNTTGSSNTALGLNALGNNTTGFFNTAVGVNTLLGNGANNVAVGFQALQNNTGGSNIALGTGAGINLTSGGFNMYLGNEGVASESTTIRIGSGSVHTRFFVAGVLTTSVTGIPVLISGTGQLGVATSSARYKEGIHDMGDASNRLAKLRPVTFRYKGHADDPVQFGLIAEEVEKVLPELVFHSASGQPESVLYNEMPAMLLNELQKQQREIRELKSELSALRAIIGQK